MNPSDRAFVSKAAAIAAGNAVVLKPSEHAPAVNSLITELCAEYLDPQLIQVVNGAVPETTKVVVDPLSEVY